jgi:putative tricarboxylic transport membrane protein
MRLNDLLIGLVLLVLAAVVAAGAWSLPNPAQQPLGPSAFPLILAGLLALCAVILAINGARAVPRGPWLVREDWTRRPAAMLRLLLVPGAVVFYMALAETLGFLPTAAVILVTLFIAGGVTLARASALALVTALVVHTVFYLGLSVQLPWGLLAPIRW